MIMNLPSEKPLQKKTIVVTRSKDQKGEATNLLNNLGAKILDLPALVIGPPDNWEPVDNALKDLGNFDWIIFSSANGVQAVETRLKIIGKCLSDLPSKLKIAAVGRKTALCLKEIGATADFIPPDFVADSLVKHFPETVLGLRILLPRVQSGGRTILAEGFGALGAQVVEISSYESTCPKSIPEITAKAFLNKEIDAITFTSGKTVDHTTKLLCERFGSTWEKQINNIKIISIGPQTSIKCIKHFGRVDKEANPHDIEGLIKACIVALQKKPL